MRGETERILSIASLENVANFILPEATVKFLGHHPTIKIRIVQKARREILPSLIKGEFDMIFSILEDEILGYDQSENQNLGHEITSQLLFYDRPSVVVRHDHPVLQAKNNIVEELLNYPWILPRPDSNLQYYLNQYYADIGLALPKIAIECQSNPYLKSLVKHSDFIGFLTTNFVSAEQQTGSITSINLPGMENSIPFGIQYRADRPVSGLVRAMIDDMKMVCRTIKRESLKSSGMLVAGANSKFTLPALTAADTADT